MNKWNDDLANRLIHQAKTNGHVLTTALRHLADRFGYIDESAIPVLAKSFNRSRAEVHGVLHYYSDFRLSPPGKHILRICQAESCQASGSRALTAQIEAKTGLALDSTNEAGTLTLEPVYCLGLCANGPAAELDGQPLAEMTAQRLMKQLSDLA